jgi:hypothetical protein
MSSTYSPSLRIELIGAGEQAGTWNTTTNTNLGTLIEASIAGYVSVSVTSANQAFTALDGAADQARNAVIALTTTTTAAFAVYAPPQEKTYIIYNTTAYTATIYNSTVLGNTTAAGLGVAVAAGKKIMVFSDGTNFREIEVAAFSGVLPVVNGGTGVTTSTGTGSVVLNTSPTLVTPALGTPTALVGTNITGTASGLTAGNVTTNANLTGAVTSVGNATSLGSFTSLQLLTALTDETGSGANVFATSPTLVTPALGTPSALVGTNITGTAAGLTAGNVTTNANLTGAVTSVGNAASLGSFTSLQLLTALTDETGTGANVFATSPTLVTPALGTPSALVGTNITGTAAGLSIGGNAATVTTNANLTGAVTSVGNATSLGSFTSLQLLTALTNETGTGSAVFATSPTLVTPLLGTPTSGTLTNCTGLPISTGVSGLGTSVAAFLATPSSANLAAALTDETGTGAVVFATSPTLVTPALGTPSALVGTNITGTAAGLSIGGNAATATSATSATNATNAVNLITTNFSIVESGGKLLFKYGATTIASMTSAGVFTAISDITAGGTP